MERAHVLGRRATDRNGARLDGEASEGRTEQVSVIAKGMKVLGDCVTDGAVRIEGAVTGSVRARKLHLTESGSVTGDVSPPDSAANEAVFLVGGLVGGAVRAAEVEVRAGGSVAGPVTADRATIRGRVEGGIVVRDRLALEETAVVEGDIQARRLAIKDGGKFDGTIRMTESVAPAVSPPPLPVPRPKPTPVPAAATPL
jgi:cytoskeletal protein CcmA (bactofilin family)